MTSTTIPNLAGQPTRTRLLTAGSWGWIAVLGLAFVLLHEEFIRRMALASKDPNWSHIIIVPLISIYYIVQHKQRLAAMPRRICWWGLPILLLGIYSYMWWIFPGRNDMLRGYSMILSLFGLTLFLLGPQPMKVLWFPIAYLILAVKIPDSLWERIANRLQDIAADGAGFLLQAFAVFIDFEPSKTGNTIVLKFMRDGLWVEEGLNIAEACSGLRMLMAFIALGVALAFLWDRAWWQRLIMIAMAIPIALAVNIGRVTALGLIYLFDKKYAQGDFHIFVGMLMLIPAAGLFLLLGWVLDRIIVRDPNAKPASENSQLNVPASAVQASAETAGVLRWKPVLIGVLVGAGIAVAAGLIYAAAFAWVPPIDVDWLFGMLPGLSVLQGVPLPVALFVPAAIAAAGLLIWWSLRRGQAVGRVLVFSLATGLLVTSAIGMQSVIAWQDMKLVKDPVPLRHELTLLPIDKGDWHFVKDDVLSKEIVEALGTEQYLSRWYENWAVPEGEPGRYVRLHVAYYTGMIDTVPHVPERCFQAGGALPISVDDVQLQIDPEAARPAENSDGLIVPALLQDPLDPSMAGTEAYLPSDDIRATQFSFLAGENADPSHVLYFFAANGKYLASPNAVRMEGFNIRDKHSYYCKIEVQVVGQSDGELATRQSEAFLDVFLPEIMAALPDWRQVRDGRWTSKSNPDL
jgi:exosortase